MHLNAFLFLSHFLVGPSPLFFFFSLFHFPLRPGPRRPFLSPPHGPAGLLSSPPFPSLRAAQAARPGSFCPRGLPHFLSLSLTLTGGTRLSGPSPTSSQTRAPARVQPRHGAAALPRVTWARMPRHLQPPYKAPPRALALPKPQPPPPARETLAHELLRRRRHCRASGARCTTASPLLAVEPAAQKLHVVVRIPAGLSFPLFPTLLCLRNLAVVPEPPRHCSGQFRRPKAPRSITCDAHYLLVQTALETEAGNAFMHCPGEALPLAAMWHRRRRFAPPPPCSPRVTAVGSRSNGLD
jgi:hypothetical protein